MTCRLRAIAILVGVVASVEIAAAAESDISRPPSFHHLHLNSVDPDAAIDFYIKQLPITSRTTWGGIPALASPKNVLVLFNKVDRPPRADSQATAFWYFGWYVADVRRNVELYKKRPDVKLVPIYAIDGASVLVSSDTWFASNTYGATYRKGGPGGPGNAYLQGPDNSLVELTDLPRYTQLAGQPPQGQYFARVLMFHDEPQCAQLWYYRHLNAPIPPDMRPPTEANCTPPRNETRVWPALQKQGLLIYPSRGTVLGGVTFPWHVRQSDVPLQSTRGHLVDHIALSVGNLDDWIAKLKSEGVRFLEEQYRLGDTRAVMIEGPSREAIELVEVQPGELPPPNHQAPGFNYGSVP